MKLKGWCLAYIGASLLIIPGSALPAAKRPLTVPEIALYQGADRQRLLEEGAKKEGRLMFYTSAQMTQGAKSVLEAFQKKYPYIQVDTWRGAATSLVPRIFEEYKAGKYIFDVVGGAQISVMMMKTEGILAPYYSPNIKYIQDDAVIKASPEGVLAVAFRESGHGVGYNTKLITARELPKTYPDLLSPNLRGKCAIVGNELGMDWMAAMISAYGEEFVRKVAKQEFPVHMVSVRTLLDMIINGEYAFSPTITEAHVLESKKKGAPVDFIPLEPVQVSVQHMALPKHPPHPHAALLFIDFQLTKEAAEMQKLDGYDPLRKDVAGVKTYKKFYGANSEEELMETSKLFKKLFLKQ